MDEQQGQSSLSQGNVSNSYKTWKLLLSFSKIYVSHISLTDFSSILQRVVWRLSQLTNMNV